MRRVSDVFFIRPESTIVVVCVALIAYFSWRNAAFYSYTNIVTMAQYTAPIAVIGAGEVLLLDLAEIDLSAGQVYLTAPWFVVLLGQHGVALGWGIALALLICFPHRRVQRVHRRLAQGPVVRRDARRELRARGIRPRRLQRHHHRHERHDGEVRCRHGHQQLGRGPVGIGDRPRHLGAAQGDASSACTRRRRAATSSVRPKPACEPGRSKSGVSSSSPSSPP